MLSDVIELTKAGLSRPKAAFVGANTVNGPETNENIKSLTRRDNKNSFNVCGQHLYTAKEKVPLGPYTVYRGKALVRLHAYAGSLTILHEYTSLPFEAFA